MGRLQLALDIGGTFTDVVMVDGASGALWTAKTPSTPKDPWTHEYKYASPGTHGAYDITSLGADGVEGGEGANKDINNWE
jgi:type II secretion system protein G